MKFRRIRWDRNVKSNQQRYKIIIWVWYYPRKKFLNTLLTKDKDCINEKRQLQHFPIWYRDSESNFVPLAGLFSTNSKSKCITNVLVIIVYKYFDHPKYEYEWKRFHVMRKTQSPWEIEYVWDIDGNGNAHSRGFLTH